MSFEPVGYRGCQWNPVDTVDATVMVLNAHTEGRFFKVFLFFPKVLDTKAFF